MGGDEGQGLGARRAPDRRRGVEQARSSSTPAAAGPAQAPLDPGAEVGHRAEGHQRGLGGTASSAQNGEGGGDVVDHVAVLGPVLGRAGQAALGVGVGAGRLAPGTVPASGWHVTRGPCRATRSSGLAPKKVPSGTGMEKMVQLGSPARRRRRTADRESGPRRWTSTGRDSTTLRSIGAGRAIGRDGSATMAA